MYSISERAYTYAQKRDAALKKSMCSTMTWQNMDTNLDSLSNYLAQGHAITHVFLNNQRLKENFLCTSFIPIDIDGSGIDMESAVEKLEKKPTFYYCTASNWHKEGYYFRFIYLFDDLIDGRHYVPLAKAVNDYIKGRIDGCNADECSERINQFFFGCDTSEVSLMATNITYRLTDFPHQPIISKVTESQSVSKVSSKKKVQMPDTPFFQDFNNMKPYDFLNKYRTKYTVKDHSEAKENKFGAEIFDKEHYEEIFRPFIKVDVNGRLYSKIRTYNDGEGRRKHLYADAIMFRKLNPNITIDELVFSLMNEIYYIGKYDNKDNELDVLGIASSVMAMPIESIDEIQYRGKRKGYKVNKDYCKEIGTSPKSYSKTVGKLLRMENVLSYYNENLSVKDNVMLLKENGINISEKTLRRYVRDKDFLKWDNERKTKTLSTIISHCPISEKRTTKKRYTDEEIGELYDLGLGLKENLDILHENGIHVGKDRLYKFCNDNGIDTNPKKKGKEK